MRRQKGRGAMTESTAGVSASDEQGGSSNRDPKQLHVFAPATGEWLGRADVADAAQIEQAIARARAAQTRWASTALEARCEQVLSLRDAIVDRADELIDLLVREAGKPRQEALVHEVMVVADLASYYAKRAPKILAPREIDLHLFKHRRSYVHYTPRGVVGIISPWNYPLLVPAGELFTALIAGNAVLHKPSELTPLVALKLKEIFDGTGLPRDLYQVLPGGGATGEALIEARPDRVFFTGSQAVGRRVASACGALLIPCTLELGGKASAIVCEDADLERAARAIVFGSFAHSGQVCVGVERVLVHASVHEQLVQRIVTLTEQLRQGDPAQSVVDLGSLISARQRERVEAMVDDALALGAQLRAGGQRRPGGGHFYQPTVLTHCSPAMRVMQQEILGPVLPVMRVDREEDAIALTNQSRLGLIHYVFTRDKLRGRRIAERLQAGTVMINEVLTAYASPELPFGGTRDSGMGSIHGDEGLKAMCETRSVDYNRGPMFKREPLWFPYRKRTYSTMGHLMRAFFRSGSPLKKAIDLL
jgi:acyl-CoA reductase-like NAD-dependent aldehyde dehydrogenase